MPRKTLYWSGPGPMVSYEWDINGEYLVVEDLNPENKIEFRFTPMQLLRLGMKCISAACLR